MKRPNEDDLSDTTPKYRRELLQYLAGAMSAADRESFEERLIGDDDFSESIEAAEFDLIDDFAAGTLPATERKQVTAWVEASPERRARVLIAQALHRSGSKRVAKPVRNSFRWFWVAALAACILLVAALQVLHRPQTPPSRSSAPAAGKTIEQAANKAPEETILLLAERLRSGERQNPATTYTLHKESAARIQIMLPASARPTTYTASLQRTGPADSHPLRFSDIAPRGAPDAPFVELSVPPGSLVSGPYEVNLQSSAGSYQLPFRVRIE